MAKKAKAKKAKAPKKAAPKKPIVARTPGGLKRLGAKVALAGAAASTHSAGTPAPTKDSFVTIPGEDGSTVVCFFNPNTGNFDICHTVAGSLGLVKT